MWHGMLHSNLSKSTVFINNQIFFYFYSMKAITILLFAMTMFFASSVTAKTSIDKDVGVQVSITNNPHYMNLAMVEYALALPKPAKTPIAYREQTPIEMEHPAMNGNYVKNYRQPDKPGIDRYGNYKFPLTVSLPGKKGSGGNRGRPKKS